MEPTRCHFSMIFEKAFTVLKQLIPTIILLAVSLRSLRIIWIISGIGVLLILAAVYLLLLWRYTFVSTSEDQLVVNSGVFWKKQTAIPFDKINTVDLSRNIIQRILGSCRLKVDTGAVKVNKSSSELDLVFSLDQARFLRKHILQLSESAKMINNPSNQTAASDTSLSAATESSIDAQAVTSWKHAESDTSRETTGAAAFFGVDELEAETDYAGSSDADNERSYKASISSLIMYSLTKSKIAAGLLAVVSLFAIFDELINEEMIAWAGDTLETAVSSIMRQQLLLMVIAAVFLVILTYVIANVISLVITIVRYFHFRVRRSSDHIYIRYGLLTEKSFSLPVKNVHAIIIRQSLIRRRFGLASIEIQSIGYGDDNKETALLLPLIKREEIDSLLQLLIPEYAIHTSLNAPPKHALRRFLLIPSLFVIALVTVPSLVFFTPGLSALAILLPLVLFSRYMSYRNSAIGYNSKIIEIRNGSWHSSLYRIRTEAVQTIGTRAHPFLRRSGLAHYELNYHAPVLSSSVWASFLDNKHFSLLRTILENSD